MASWEVGHDDGSRLSNGALSASLADRSDKLSKRSSRDITTDETISILDPRRFTPTLHANLVSEILSLRRDQDDKTRLIESLEATLHSTKEDHEVMQQSLATVSKESRSLKRQMSLLEGGTSSALGELARERDDAVDSVSDTKKRLEAAQKKLRSQDDATQRAHDIWEKDKDTWANERRKYERRIHIAENRLKSILDEVAAYQTAHAQTMQSDLANRMESETEEMAKDGDGASIRTMSLTNSLRYSTVHSPGPVLPTNGHSLADELGFDADDDDQTDYDARESVFSSPEQVRPPPQRSSNNNTSRRHLRNQSIESLTQSLARSTMQVNHGALNALEGEGQVNKSPRAFATYVETGVQYSPPPSPKLKADKELRPQSAVMRLVQNLESENTPRADTEIEANQRRKRTQFAKTIGSVEAAMTSSSPKHMVSSAAQTLTLEAPISPPRTPKLDNEFDLSSSHEEAEEEEKQQQVSIQQQSMVSSSTQTDPERPIAAVLQRLSPSPSFASLPSPSTFPIPSINIHPPTSRPTTPHSPRLPPYFKHFGCQVNITSTIERADAAVQTEGIQVDKRIARLPAHLQPSSITSRPSSPVLAAVTEPEKSFTPVPGNRVGHNPLRIPTLRAGDIQQVHMDALRKVDGPGDSYPGNNDNGPLSTLEASALRRPQRISSLFAGFDSASSDEGEEFRDADVSDSEYRTALSAPKPPSTTTRSNKRRSYGTNTTASPEPSIRQRGYSGISKSFGVDLQNSFGISEASNIRDSIMTATNSNNNHNSNNKHSRMSSRTSDKSSALLSTTSSNYGSIRKTAMIQSGVASQQTRARSPSLPEGKNPPFPIPRRDSSKRLPYNPYAASDGRDSPPDAWHSRNYSRSQNSNSNSNSNMRRVRSAAAITKTQRSRRHGSRSPPPLSVSTEAPESPSLPPLPRNDLTTPRHRDRSGSHYRRHRHDLSTNTDNTLGTYTTDPMSVSQGSGSQSTGVVDAIAQTMVGEWMYKYVRRRKSFSVPDSVGKDDSGNDRHKRWVWLAPYERSILWSSRQPSSGSALMGKSGRKLTIQSVLDVKDDNPAPKMAGPVFNRSILILTPQRALKFTATSADRHYLWLTALSFLAHSSQAVPEIIAAPQVQQLKPVQQALPEFEVPRSKARKPGIRDSIRLAKGRTTQSRPGPPSVPSLPSAPSTRIGEVASFRMPASSGTGVISQHNRDDSRDAAQPPMIPRFNDKVGPVSSHGRKRSNTGGHVPPPLSFRGFSGPVGSPALTDSTANNSVETASSDMYQSQASSNTTWGVSYAGSQRTSEASSRPGGNFFDAVGTVRMEAFISPMAFAQINDNPEDQGDFRRQVRRRSKEIRRRNSRSRHRDSFSRSGRGGYDDYRSGSRTAGEEEYFRDDPFKGF